MTGVRVLSSALVLALSLSAASAAATVPLRDEAHINGQLLAAQVGDILRKTCPKASARVLVFYDKARALERYALGKGYTEAEVRAFLDNRAEKARIRRQADAYLAKAGAVKGNPDSYCAVARAEVASKSLTGQLLRVGK